MNARLPNANGVGHPLAERPLEHVLPELELLGSGQALDVDPGGADPGVPAGARRPREDEHPLGEARVAVCALRRNGIQ